jgi:hypothetical protein
MELSENKYGVLDHLKQDFDRELKPVPAKPKVEAKAVRSKPIVKSNIFAVEPRKVKSKLLPGAFEEEKLPQK